MALGLNCIVVGLTAGTVSCTGHPAPDRLPPGPAARQAGEEARARGPRVRPRDGKGQPSWNPAELFPPRQVHSPGASEGAASGGPGVLASCAGSSGSGASSEAFLQFQFTEFLRLGLVLLGTRRRGSGSGRRRGRAVVPGSDRAQLPSPRLFGQQWAWTLRLLSCPDSKSLKVFGLTLCVYFFNYYYF